jgi:hypothetical protein
MKYYLLYSKINYVGIKHQMIFYSSNIDNDGIKNSFINNLIK